MNYLEHFTMNIKYQIAFLMCVRQIRIFVKLDIRLRVVKLLDLRYEEPEPSAVHILLQLRYVMMR